MFDTPPPRPPPSPNLSFTTAQAPIGPVGKNLGETSLKRWGKWAKTPTHVTLGIQDLSLSLPGLGHFFPKPA